MFTTFIIKRASEDLKSDKHWMNVLGTTSLAMDIILSVNSSSQTFSINISQEQKFLPVLRNNQPLFDAFGAPVFASIFLDNISRTPQALTQRWWHDALVLCARSGEYASLKGAVGAYLETLRSEAVRRDTKLNEKDPVEFAAWKEIQKFILQEQPIASSLTARGSVSGAHVRTDAGVAMSVSAISENLQKRAAALVTKGFGADAHRMYEAARPWFDGTSHGVLRWDAFTPFLERALIMERCGENVKASYLSHIASWILWRMARAIRRRI